MANAITLFRIICSAAILFCPVFSTGFYVLYLLAGASDMADGAVARRTNTQSRLGTDLDAAADLVFAAVCLIKLLPAIEVPPWVYAAVAVTALVKLINLAIALAKKRRPLSVHTRMNKLVGLLLFLLPLTLSFIDLGYSAAVLCALALLAALREGQLVVSGDAERTPDI